MNRIETSKMKVKELLENHQKLDFPGFLSGLRKSLAITRQVMANDLQIPYLKLFYLEIGGFKNPPQDTLLVTISDYFGVPYKIMSEKLSSFVGRGR